MVTFKEYYNKTIGEGWERVGVLPDEKYDFPDPFKNINWIDLGLPSGTCWADKNIENSDNGIPYWSYAEIMDSDYAPYVPTKEQIWELCDNCKLWLDKVKEGMVFTSMANGKEIFTPADGFRNREGKVDNVGAYGNYYSASCSSSNPRNVFSFYFSMDDPHPAFTGQYFGNSYLGRSVRLVRNKN